MSPQQDARAVFALYEGFERDLSQFSVSAPCGDDGVPVAAETSTRVPFAGARSLYLGPGRSSVTRELASPMPAYRLRAWMWDSGAASAASFLSPDYPACSTEGGLAVTAASTSAGIYSPADAGAFRLVLNCFELFRMCIELS